MARLDELIAANQRSAPVAVDARAASIEARRSLCIVTCVDPRLTRFFSTVLGVDRGDAVLIRIPGANLLAGQGAPLRAVAAAVYINQANEILVLGHTDCGTTRIDASAIASRMQAAGLVSQSMPGGPREFLGGVGDIRQAIRASAAAVRAAPFLPRDLLVHAALLDIQTGVLEILERGESAQTEAAGSIDSALTYRPGAAGLPANPLGDGLLLLASTSHTLFSDTAALTFNGDALATPASMASSLPAGWADGAVSLAPVAISSGTNTLDGVGNAGAAPAISSTINLGFQPVDLTPGIDVTSFATSTAAPRPKAPTATSSGHTHPKDRSSASAKKKSPRAREADVEVSVNPASRRVDPEVQANLDKVRAFYRAEFATDRRKNISRALSMALNGGQSTEQLLKLILRPILDAGQKRYQVIDEMIAVKSSLTGLTPEEAYAILSRLVD